MTCWGSSGRRRDLGLLGGGRAAKEWTDKQDEGKRTFSQLAAPHQPVPTPPPLADHGPCTTEVPKSPEGGAGAPKPVWEAKLTHLSEQTCRLPQGQPPICSQPPERAGSAVHPEKLCLDTCGCGGSTGLSDELLSRQGNEREDDLPLSLPISRGSVFVYITMKRRGFCHGSAEQAMFEGAFNEDRRLLKHKNTQAP